MTCQRPLVILSLGETGAKVRAKPLAPPIEPASCQGAPAHDDYDLDLTMHLTPQQAVLVVVAVNNPSSPLP